MMAVGEDVGRRTGLLRPAAPKGVWGAFIQRPRPRRGLPLGCDEAGQALVLTVLFMGLVVVAVFAAVGLGLGYADHAGAQSAADAAATACATQGVITKTVDARGTIYSETVKVNPETAPGAAAQAWGRNIAYWPVRTEAFAAVASGAHCTVSAWVRARIGVLGLLGRNRVAWTVEAKAKAYVQTF